MSLRRRLGADVGFDIGTCNCSVFLRGQGEVFREPSTVAFGTRSNALAGLGTDAEHMAERHLSDVTIIRPMVAGTVAHYDAGLQMIKGFLARAVGRRLFAKPRVIAAITPGATPVEQYVLRSAFLEAGVAGVTFVDSTLADALGSGLAAHETASRMIVNIGGGTADVGIISGGVVAVSRSFRFGGRDLDEGVRRFVKQKYGLLVSPLSAEKIKIRVGSVLPDAQRESISFDGVELYGELFRSITVSLEGIPQLLARTIDIVATEIRWLLEEVDEEHRKAVIANGIAMSGGTSLLRGVARLMTEKLGIPVSTVPNPTGSTIAGVGTVLQDPRRLKLDGRQYLSPSVSLA